MSDPVAGLSVHTCTGNLVLGFSLLKTMNYRESLEVFQRDRRSVGTRDLILEPRRPLWGAPRVRGALRKLGIEVNQATVGR